MQEMSGHDWFSWIEEAGEAGQGGLFATFRKENMRIAAALFMLKYCTTIPES
jgi:hypothetical protein